MYIRVPINYTSAESVSHFKGDLIRSLTGLGQAPALPDLSAWSPLISFRPPATIQHNIKSRGGLFKWYVLQIEKHGIGPVNLDYYPVEVFRLPKLNGQSSNPAQFLEHIRLHINDFLHPGLTRFRAYDQKEARLWASSKPLGAVLSLRFRVMTSSSTSGIVQDGSVVVADFKSNKWIVSTIWTGADWAHPLCGNREWGYTPPTERGSFIYYTRAADRITDPQTILLKPTLTTGIMVKGGILYSKEQIYTGQREFWSDFQQRICNFVNEHKGNAQVLTPSETRYDWAQVQAQYHSPTVSWI